MLADVVDTESGLGQVRHPINQASLEKYLVSSYPLNFSAPFSIKQFGFGQSNPSYQLCDAKGRKYVLRKKPPGKLVSKTAHAVDREFYMLQAIYNMSNNNDNDIHVPVPKVICLCQDESVIGTEFYIMEFVKGRIFHYPNFPDLSPKDRKECWESAIETLANLHRLDPSKLPKIFTKRMESHFPRQLGSLSAVAQAQAQVKDMKTNQPIGPIPHFEEIVNWMKHNLPKDNTTSQKGQKQLVSIVHGDYKIDNLIFHPTENKVIAILDWELCTVGHPLADLANLLQPFTWPESSFGKNIGLLDTKYPLPAGLITVKQALDLYKQITGYDAAIDWPFAQVSAHFRLSVIAHGIKARFVQGQASSPNAAEHVEKIGLLTELAMDEIKKTPNKHLQAKI